MQLKTPLLLSDFKLTPMGSKSRNLAAAVPAYETIESMKKSRNSDLNLIGTILTQCDSLNQGSTLAPVRGTKKRKTRVIKK